jgi:hypothetical protein
MSVYTYTTLCDPLAPDWTFDTIALNSAALRGAVGASDGGPVADAMTTQLVQAMAAHGADSGVENLHTAVQAEPQQQPLLTTPHA